MACWQMLVTVFLFALAVMPSTVHSRHHKMCIKWHTGIQKLGSMHPKLIAPLHAAISISVKHAYQQRKVNESFDAKIAASISRMTLEHILVAIDEANEQVDPKDSIDHATLKQLKDIAVLVGEEVVGKAFDVMNKISHHRWVLKYWGPFRVSWVEKFVLYCRAVSYEQVFRSRSQKDLAAEQAKVAQDLLGHLLLHRVE